MAKSAEPKKAAKKEKVEKVKKSGLSEDRVVDSDSESEQKTKKTKSPAKPVEKVKKDKTDKTKTKTKTKKAAASPPPPPPPKEESSSEDGSDDLDGDDESTASEKEQVAAKKTVNGVKRKADEASDDDSSSSSEEESSEAEETQPAAKKAKTQQSQPKKPAAPAASSSSEEEEAAPAPPSSIPAAAFSAPKDFQPIDLSKTHPTLSSSTLQGKQIWHITAPSSLPITDIQSVALDAISNGTTVLTHKGSAYSLSEDPTTNSTAFSVFLPSKEGYKATEMPVSKTLRLHQKIELPKLGERQANMETGAEAAADVWANSRIGGEGVRPQPKGMRMRYKPPGFGLGEPGLGSDDDEEVEEGFKLPKTKKARKERRESGEGMEGVEMTGGKALSKEERKKAKKEAKARAAAASQ